MNDSPLNRFSNLLAKARLRCSYSSPQSSNSSISRWGQISKGDVHYARFGMMLTDNAVELILHQIAKDKASNLKMYA